MDDETRHGIAVLTERMGQVESRVRFFADLAHHEVRTGDAWRDHWGAELDALIAEVAIVQVALRHIEQRLQRLEERSMPSRDELLGDALTKTIGEINAVVKRRLPPEWAEDVDLLFRLFGDFWAQTLGRATEMASGAVVRVVQPLDARITALEERAVGDDTN